MQFTTPDPPPTKGRTSEYNKRAPESNMDQSIWLPPRPQQNNVQYSTVPQIPNQPEQTKSMQNQDDENMMRSDADLDDFFQ